MADGVLDIRSKVFFPTLEMFIVKRFRVCLCDPFWGYRTSNSAEKYSPYLLSISSYIPTNTPTKGSRKKKKTYKLHPQTASPSSPITQSLKPLSSSLPHRWNLSLSLSFTSATHEIIVG